MRGLVAGIALLLGSAAHATPPVTYDSQETRMQAEPGVRDAYARMEPRVLGTLASWGVTVHVQEEGFLTRTPEKIAPMVEVIFAMESTMFRDWVRPVADQLRYVLAAPAIYLVEHREAHTTLRRDLRSTIPHELGHAIAMGPAASLYRERWADIDWALRQYILEEQLSGCDMGLPALQGHRFIKNVDELIAWNVTCRYNPSEEECAFVPVCTACDEAYGEFLRSIE